MTETSKVRSWAYPTKIGANDVTDPQQYYKALAAAKDGYFPLGKNGLWHGGIHLDDASGLVADQSEVRCIADGEVIAYRIDEQYATSQYGDKSAVYSTGFVLVKHRMEVPAPPPPATAPGTPAPGAPAPAAATPSPSLTFYSLYMHLLDWKTYQTQTAIKGPDFWQGEWAVSASAEAKIKGLNVRDKDKGGAIIGFLPRGTVVTTGEAGVGGKYLKLLSAEPPCAGLALENAWVYKNEMDSLGENKYRIGTHAPNTPPQKIAGTNVLATASNNGTHLGYLPAGTKVRIGAVQGHFYKLDSIVSGESVPTLTPGADGKLPGYILKSAVESKREPETKGAVFVLPTPIAVKAGAVIGHVGKMQNHDDPQPRNLLHLEVFTCEDFPAFVAKSIEAAKALPAEQKTLVELPPSTKVIPHQAGFSKDNPPQISMAGELTAYKQIIPVSVLESLPAANKIKIETPQPGGSPTVVNWWRLEGVLGGANNQPLSGWVREQEIMSPRHNPWEWDGFDFLEETSTNLQNWATYLHDQNSLTDEEKSIYKPAPSGPVKERLYDIIDADQNDKLTVAEIVGALGKPWHAQSISQLVVKYESEWLYKADKWSSLDQYMGSPNPSWDAEKARIEKLAWWGDLAGKQGISADGKVWHLHAVSLKNNFNTPSHCICVKCGKNIALTAAFMKKIVSHSVTDEFIANFVQVANSEFPIYGVNTCAQVIYLLGQGNVETMKFTKFRESLNYTKASYTAASLYAMAPTAINAGFARLGMTFPSTTEKLQYVGDHLLANDSGYGQHCFGSDAYPNNDYRGRGLLHLTFFDAYRRCGLAIGARLDEHPELLETDVSLIIKSGLWFWKSNSIGAIADKEGQTLFDKVKSVTYPINSGYKALAERRESTSRINDMFQQTFGQCGVI